VEARLLLLIGVAPPAQLVRALAEAEAPCLSGVASPSSTTTFFTDLEAAQNNNIVISLM
jgi:hypothetical protein